MSEVLSRDDIERISKSWKQDKFTIGETHFRVRKLLAEEAFEVFEIMRVGFFGSAIDGVDVSGKDLKFSDILIAAMRLPRPVVREIREGLFREVWFTNQATQTPTVVRGNEGMAFMDLDFTAIYEVLMRAIAINFGESLSENLRRVMATTPNTKR